jgi:hypothetical protein
MIGNGPRTTDQGQRTFVGFGFGPIQAGLFLDEAYRSRSFGWLVVAEVLPEIVSAVRGAVTKRSVGTECKRAL